MKNRLFSWAGVLVFAVACGSQYDGGVQKGGETPVDPSNLGSLALNLIGQDSAGNQYRLRNADFQLSGYPDYYIETISGSGGEGGAFIDSNYHLEQFSSEESPNAAVIKRRVVPGYYYVYLLNSDFYLERITPSGPERVQKLVLLSDRYQSVRVWEGSTSTIHYRFGVDGDVIDFRSGDIEIKIDIERPGERFPIGGAAGAVGAGGEPSAGGAFAE